jgi:AcrR family transcriptional regulator
VLEESGLEALTIAAVAGRAGVSVGSVYNRFADKDTLVVALHDAFVASLVSEDDEFAPEVAATLQQLLHELVAAHCRLMGSHGPLMRVFMHLTAVNPDMAPRAAESTRAIGQQFTQRLLAYPHAEIARPDPAFAADVCFEMVHDVVARRVARGGTFESDVELSWERLGEELTQLCVAYLRAPAR